MKRQSWIEPKADISIKRQCVLASVCRATVYAKRKPKQEQERDATLMGLIDQEYTRHPYYGSRKMVVYLAMQGQRINRKCVQRLMRSMGLQAMAPSPNTSKPKPAHKVYPYLLRGVSIVRPNQVWSSDITYIRLAHGFAYLTVVLDWYSRCVLSWRISNTMDARFCVDCLEEALAHYGKPEVFNSDQGSQYTSTEFTAVLKREGVAISMDGRGRAFDNIFVERLWRSVKHEDVYLKGYATMGQLWLGINAYFAHYNAHRPHQSLGQCTPQDVYRSAQGGGAISTDKYGDRPTCAQAVSMDKAPAPNRSRSVGTAPTGCVPCPQTPTGLVLGKEQYLFKFKTQNGTAPSSCVVTEQT